MKKPVSLTEAKAILFVDVLPLTETEVLPLQKTLGRTSGQDVISQINLPPFTNSAMDGYALRASGREAYTCIGESLAGHPFQGELKAHECIRIFTGAVLPQGADAVIAQEDVRVVDDQIIPNVRIQGGQHVRIAGMDKQSGQLLLRQGQPLTSAHLGLLASAGVEQISVVRKIRVALLTTGDELVEAGEPLAEGQIYESNLLMLATKLDPALCQTVAGIRLPDNKTQIESQLAKLADTADVVIASGGMSVGDTDFMVSVLQEQGQLHFWRIALKPGMPFVYGKLGKAVFFGLPGNPVSTIVTLTELVTPYLVQMSGRPPKHPLRLQATLRENLQKTSDRTEFFRGYLVSDAKGYNEVTPIADQRSNRISSLTEANCYIILSAKEPSKNAGDLVVVQPIGPL